MFEVETLSAGFFWTADDPDELLRFDPLERLRPLVTISQPSSSSFSLLLLFVFLILVPIDSSIEASRTGEGKLPVIGCSARLGVLFRLDEDVLFFASLSFAALLNPRTLSAQEKDVILGVPNVKNRVAAGLGLLRGFIVGLLHFPGDICFLTSQANDCGLNKDNREINILSKK